MEMEMWPPCDVTLVFVTPLFPGISLFILFVWEKKKRRKREHSFMFRGKWKARGLKILASELNVV